MLKGLFRMPADALERQGRIIIVVVVRFACDTPAACESCWDSGKGASLHARLIIQASSYVVSHYCSNDLRNCLYTDYYSLLYRAPIASLKDQSM